MANKTPFFKAFGPLLFGRPAKRPLQKLARLTSVQELYEIFGHLLPEGLLAATKKGTNSRDRLFNTQREIGVRRHFVTAIRNCGQRQVMPRSIRLECVGAFYHVMARGNRREAIYADDDDRRFFLRTLGEACGMTGWRVHAWVLMSNHDHLVIETPEANLVAGMQWLQNTFTRRFNVRHGWWGRLFGDRYKAVLVEGGRQLP